MTLPVSLLVKLPGIPPNANDIRRAGRWGDINSRRTWLATALHATKDAMNRTGWKAPEGRAHVHAAFHYPDKRRRDPDNAIAGLKPILDGLVAAGALKDDDFHHVILTVEATFGEKEAATWITVGPEA